MLGKFIGGANKRIASRAAFSTQNAYDNSGVASTEGIPRAPPTAFRKRPVKLTYDKNEYWTFRLPSENAQLFSHFNKEELFGTYQGVNYSPHIQSQVTLDTKLLWVIGGLSIFGMLFLGSQDEKISALRMNYRNSHMGHFTVDDLIEKKEE